MRVPTKLNKIFRVDGYTIGRCDNEIYLVDPEGLMTWPNSNDEAYGSTLGLPKEVPSRVVLYVIRMLKSNESQVQPIRYSVFSPIPHHHPIRNESNLMSNQTAWLFPGQGSQNIGMGSSLQAMGDYYDSAFDLAEEFSELPLRQCIARGPEPTLTNTAYAQPAIVALSVAYTDFLRDHDRQPMAVAGHSLGEFGALYAAGVLSAKDTLRLAASRGKLMSESAQGTMVAVKGLNSTDVQQIVDATGSTALVVANLNTPEQTVVSGGIDSIDEFEGLLSDAGHRFVRLNVSGAWHSPLVADAAQKFQAVLESAEWCEPQADVYLGAVGERVNDVDEIQAIMNRQIISPVHWHKTIESMIRAGLNQFVEVGPGKVLRGLMRKAVAPGTEYDIHGVDNKRFVKQLSQNGGTIAS